MNFTTASSISYRIPWLRGLAFGILSFAATFGLTWYFVSLGPTPNLVIDVADWKLKTWYFFDAHFVSLSQTLSSGGESMAAGEQIDLLSTTEQRATFAHVIPLLCCMIGAVLLNVRMGGSSRIGFNLFNGVQIVTGYLPAVLVSTFLSSYTISGLGMSARMGPDYVEAIVLAGLIIPALGGAAGGFLYHLSREL